jgi:hypothetical protein
LFHRLNNKANNIAPPAITKPAVKSPLYIKYPNGETRVIEEIFQHPKGILYFELFWEKDPKYSIHLIEGEITGDGPWRVGFVC